MEDIKNTILQLEKDLLLPEVRKSAEKISEILDHDFFEFCGSGKIYKYTEGDVFEADPETVYKIYNFNIKILTDNQILATYMAVKSSDDYNTSSLRSSIWERKSNVWRIIFHQGTVIRK